ncbi:MAG: N-6 DNA methylase, partial [Bacteriovoracaceae bacterium]|nr:N-6 DNA methylase [Bacteriovoracaceae bacterium]
DRLENAGENIEEREKELLSIKVCDPACGSGAFLIAACNRLGSELAKLRYGEDLPPQNILQEARRDVLQHCIYGVDLNPMGVELAKVSLWINAIVRDKPLNFLDHHIKCGNSLIGATAELMKKGIPTEAFNPVVGDDKKVAQYFKKINREQLKNTTFTQWLSREDTSRICFEKFVELDEAEESDPQEVNRKKEQYEQLVHSFDYNKVKFLADLWTSAFFWNLTNKEMEVPTQDVFTGALLQGASSVSFEITKKVSELADEYHFFHWHVEFPEVFGDVNPGFDCMLGNPPWERIKLQEKEFFEYLAPEITNAQNAAARKKLIEKLHIENPSLELVFKNAKRTRETEAKFLRNSNRFPLTGKGDTNTYTVFTEHARNLIKSTGRVGIIVPSGIATDKTTSEFFGDIVDNKSLVSMYDFENKNGYFPIHRSFKFCLLTMSGKMGYSIFDFAFFLHDIDDLNDEVRHFPLTPEDIQLINPNTRNCPIFRNKIDARINKKIYGNVPVLINEMVDINHWGVYYMRLVHFGDFADDLRFPWEDKGPNWDIPVYESKMIWAFDHRLSTFMELDKSAYYKGKPRFVSSEEKKNPFFKSENRYFINKKLSEKLFAKYSNYTHNCLLVWRDITNATNERTSVATIIPKTAASVTCPALGIEKDKNVALILANFNSFIFDYFARQKVGGSHLNWTILTQLPIIPSDYYSQEEQLLITSRIVELVYTAWDLEPFAQDVLNEIGANTWNQWFAHNPLQNNRPYPFRWDEERRAQLRAEIDAIYAHLYGISKDDLDYILDTFPIVKRKDEAKYGTYRTKDLILEYYDEYEGKIEPVSKEEN